MYRSKIVTTCRAANRKAWLALLLLFSCLQAGAQNISLTGTVLDREGKPMQGASVIVKGTTTGVSTDVTGSFSLKEIAPQSVLTVSHLGHSSTEVAVNGQTRINVTLSEENNSLDEVIVIGYGTMQRKDMTGAITSISGEDLLLKAPVSLFDALQGSATGVMVTSDSGAPGAEADIRIRGTSTFGSGVSPLYVVDGMPMDDISAINTTDIQSIDILKDAASSAIYGSRSANGVIIITTKKGTVGAPKIDIKYSRSFSKLQGLIELPTPAQSRYWERTAYNMSGKAIGYMTDDTLRRYLNFDGNTAKYLFRTGIKDQVDLSVSGSNDKNTYYIGLGFLQDKGVVINSDYTRVSLRINNQYKPVQKLTLGARMQFSYAEQHGIDESTVASSLWSAQPYIQIWDVTGEFPRRSTSVASASSKVAISQKFRNSIFLYGEYDFNPHLKLTINLAPSLSVNTSNDYTPTILLNSSGSTTGVDKTHIAYDYLNENLLSYSKTFCRDHNFSAMVGFSAQKWFNKDVAMKGLDYASDLIYTVNAASAIDITGTYSTIEKNAMASFFSRVTYNYKSRYLFAANIRDDGSSRFGPAKRWGAFPSVSAGWRFSDESFMKWAKPILTDGKLRGSFGVTGNERIGNYDYWLIYSANNIYEGITGIAPSVLASSTLGWEQTNQWNFGVDLSLFDQRLSVTADYYVKNTSDLLYDFEVPKETGYSTIKRNVGAMQNKGYELSIDGIMINNKVWKWSANFSLSHNNAITTKLADGMPFYVGQNNSIYVQQGHRIGEFYGYQHEGIFAYDESNAFDEHWNQLTPIFVNGQFDHYTLNGTLYNGNVQQKVSAASGLPYKAGNINWRENPNHRDGVIDNNDKVSLGCAQPDLFGTLGTTLTYRNYSLYVSFYYSLGGQIYNAQRYQRNSFQSNTATPERFVLANMWLNPGDEALYPAPRYDTPDDYALTPSDFWIEDASYIRLRTVRFSYDLSKKVCQKIRLRAVQAYIYGGNLITWTKYKGFDPEFGGKTPLDFGVDNGKYPRKAEVGLGINVSF